MGVANTLAVWSVYDDNGSAGKSLHVAIAVDAALIASARASDAGLERLIITVWPEAYRLALSILHDRGMAEDAAQEACASIARSLPRLRDSSTFSAWSYKIVVNHALTVARRRPRAASLDTVDGRESYDPSDAIDLYRALASLSPVQRAAILLRYHAGLRSHEIAAATGLPPSTVRFHLMLARRALRNALSDTGRPHVRSGKEVLPDAR